MNSPTENEISISSKMEVVSFYDAFSVRLIRDYIQGNRRFERALEFVEDQVESKTGSVLDVGCGIGASAYELKRRFPRLNVDAIDISPRNIEVAQKLFGDAKIEYSVSDIAEEVSSRRYDLIVMIDVHEHIPRADWPIFHKAIRDRLSEYGSLVMTYPSEAFQDYILRNDPEALQVIDESITLEDISVLADRIGGGVKYYKQVSVYRSGDYVHLVISRTRDSTRVSGLKPGLFAFVAKMRKALRTFRRRMRVRRRLSGITLSARQEASGSSWGE